MAIDKKDLLKVLMQVEDNLHTSASSEGLKCRVRNLREMEDRLLSMLELTEEEAESLWEELNPY